MSNAAEFSEEEYPSERLNLSSPQSRQSVFSHDGSRGDLNVTEIRGRKYTLSPAASPTKSPSRHKTVPQGSRVRRSISFTDKTKRPTRKLSAYDTFDDEDPPVIKRRKKSGTSTRAKKEKKESRSLSGDNMKARGANGVSRTQDEPTRPTQERAHKTSEDVVFPSGTVSKWQPLSQDVISLFDNVLLAALGHVTSTQRGVVKTRTEKSIQNVIKEVHTELNSAKAPKHKKAKAFTRAGQDMMELKEKCTTLVQRNIDLKERLEERKRMVDDLTKKTDLLRASGHSQVRKRHTRPGMDGVEGEEQFKDYISELMIG